MACLKSFNVVLLNVNVFFTLLSGQPKKNQVKPKGSPTPAAVVLRENVVGTSLRIITMMMKFIFNLGLPLGKTKLE